ncbi:hypothetical protein SELMODRAFT_156096 [Selaginella moellendorffii]|uniref:Uncharacterized protein n=1 Tax=Selaginella moellendorffii TaxID=88036 RepID=D8SK91_SELML|nr:GDSL esterase/lipase At5g62930 [Selaginella moellendorffii]EFJ15187.1 hypothetical protein SELMODRAFT_156096 [Selaginella moellendorffii]|eukprot:XP_002983691.1 GDSL esterase/lipase At5g62930 [Selaginella moellendorffii]
MGPARPRIVLFGDSITQQSFGPGGWGAALAHHYCRKADIVLRGYSGYNSSWALFLLHKIFPSSLEEDAPLAVTIFFGANDAALPDRGSSHQHVPLPTYKTNLKRIISHLKAVSKRTHIVLITPPPIDEKARREFAIHTYGRDAHELPERTNAVAQEYASACKAVAAEENVAVIDLWTLFQKNHDWRSIYLSDGLHLTAAGNGVVFDQVVQAFKLAGIAEAELSLDFPLHSSIDKEHPEIAFST